ncbi:MAG: alkaline phosphatase [Saprospiraceae bacterium]
MKKSPILFLLLLMAACHPKQPTTLEEATLPEPTDSISFTPPKNIVLMIGDGMGLTQITAGLYMNGNKLNLEQFQYIGLHKSYSSNDLITDSAAGATAFASGKKTYNGAIGLDAGGKPAKTILEEAEAAGMSTGLVVTSSITHATPACFYAHERDRGLMEQIAGDLSISGVDFFVGGGKKYFDRRLDERNLIKEMEGKGFVISNFIDTDFNNVSIDFNKKFGYFTADAEPLPRSQGRDYFVQACQSALNYLSSQNDKGFFLMIEGSQIDWGGHANNSDYIISEMIEFDQAIGVVLDFAKQDGETLIIVTADHETGGYAINPGSTWDSIIPAFTTDKHTAVLIPVFAFGPGQELFGGLYENTAIFDKMNRALGFIKS